MNAARLHETPLHHATKNKQVEMVEILVEFGANVHARDHHDKKPVDYTTPGSPSATCLQFYESEFLLKHYQEVFQCSSDLSPADGEQGSHFSSFSYFTDVDE